MEPDLEQVHDSIERLIDIARTVDYDLVRGRGEQIARLIVEARYFAELTAGSDPFETGELLFAEMRRRRRLA